MKDLEIKLDKTSKVKLYHQLYLFFINAIEKKELSEGSKLPSIRVLSEKYNISRNTVTKAYSELELSGYVYSLSKSGFFVKNPENKATDNIGENGQPEKDNIPTVDSIIKERMKESVSQKEPSSKIFENLNKAKTSETFIIQDPFSSEPYPDSNSSVPVPVDSKDRTFLMNSGDFVKSAPLNKKIISPLEDFLESSKTAIQENKKRIERNKKTDPLGETPLRVATAAFLYKFHHIDINPSRIVIGLNRAHLLFQLLFLDELKKPKRKLHGLLQMAEKSMNNKDIQPSIAVPEGFNSSLRDVFYVHDFDVKEINFDSKESISALLEKSGASLVFVYAKDIHSIQKKKEILDWACKENFRYIIECDTSTEISKEDFIYNIDCNEKCIYLMSFSNLISKSINATVSALPKNLLESYKLKYKNFGSPLSMLTQMTLTDFLIKDKLINYLSNIEQI